MQLKDECLALGKSLPTTLANLDAEEKKSAIRDHVAFVAATLGGAGCAKIDVINECVSDAAGRRALVPFWTDDLELDEDGAAAFLAELFRVARAHAPYARLCIRDYGTADWNEKSTFLYSLCDRIKKAGGPVDEVGLQTQRPIWEITLGMRANMQRFKALGMTCSLSEGDIMCDGLGGDDAINVAAAPAAAEPAWNVFTEAAIMSSIRQAVREMLNPPLAWRAYWSDVSPGLVTQNRGGGAWSGPQCRLPADTPCALKTKVLCASGDVWLTLKSSDGDGSGFWEYTCFKDQKIGDGAITFHTTKKKYNVVYLEGPPPETDFVVGPTFLNGEPLTWDSTFPEDGSLLPVTIASGRMGAWGGLMVAPAAGKVCTLTTKVYSHVPLKLTLRFWDHSKGQFGYSMLARADSAGAIAATFEVPGATPDGTPACAFIESESDKADFAAEAPTVTISG